MIRALVKSGAKSGEELLPTRVLETSGSLPFR
jgi:hypothetical protein